MSYRAAFIAEHDGQRLIYFISEPTIERNFETGRITVSGTFLGGQRWEGAMPSPAVEGGPEPLEGT